jgi:hypothetical protein
MPYVPRPTTSAQCAHCNATFEKRHASRKYCSNSCNVQASYARTGYREARATRADLEQILADMKQLMLGKLAPAPPKPAAKAAATKPAPKITKPTSLAPAAKAAATKPAKKITTPAPPKPTAKAAALPAKKKAAPKTTKSAKPAKDEAYQARLKAAQERLRIAAKAKAKEREEEEYLGWSR